MADKLLTLCEACAKEMRIGGMRVRPIPGKTTTEKKRECENCGQHVGGLCKQYLVGGKGR